MYSHHFKYETITCMPFMSKYMFMLPEPFVTNNILLATEDGHTLTVHETLVEVDNSGIIRFLLQKGS